MSHCHTFGEILPKTFKGMCPCPNCASYERWRVPSYVPTAIGKELGWFGGLPENTIREYCNDCRTMMEIKYITHIEVQECKIIKKGKGEEN